MSENPQAPDDAPGNEVPVPTQEAEERRRGGERGRSRGERAADEAEVSPELRDLSREHPRPGEHPPAAH